MHLLWIKLFVKELLFIQVYVFVLPNVRFNNKLSNCKDQIVNCKFSMPYNYNPYNNYKICDLNGNICFQ
jgi:hypothetical protein